MTAVLSKLRASNRHRLIRALWRMDAASRADLAKAAQVSSVTAGKIVDDLLEQGVLAPVESLDGARPGGALAGVADHACEPVRGRPGQLVQLDRRRRRFVLLQMGVAHTRATLATAGGHNLDVWDATTDTPRDFDAWFKQACAMIGPMLESPGLWGIVLSVSGIVDEVAGRVLYSPNMHSSEHVDLRGLFAGLTALPVIVVQEIRALAMGHLTANPDQTDFLLVDFGQGVGGAAVIGGRLFLGALPMSGEIGHTPIAGTDRLCGCGGVGCLETLISRNALIRAAGVDNWRALQELLKTGDIPDWLGQALDAAARTIAGACNALGMQRVVLTGSLTELAPQVIERVCDGVRAGAIGSRFGTLECHSAPRRRIAGMVRIALEKLVLSSTFNHHESTKELL